MLQVIFRRWDVPCNERSLHPISRVVVNDRANSSSFPSTIPKTTPETLVEDPEKSAPPTESETLVTLGAKYILDGVDMI